VGVGLVWDALVWFAGWAGIVGSAKLIPNNLLFQIPFLIIHIIPTRRRFYHDCEVTYNYKLVIFPLASPLHE
jgi:hypothetical protein